MKTPCARNVSIETVDTSFDPFLRVRGLEGPGITQFDHADDAHLLAGIELLAGGDANVVERGGKFYVQLRIRQAASKRAA